MIYSVKQANPDWEACLVSSLIRQSHLLFWPEFLKNPDWNSPFPMENQMPWKLLWRISNEILSNDTWSTLCLICLIKRCMYLEFCFHHAQFYLQNPNPFLKPLPFLVFSNPKESNRFLKYKQVSFPFFCFFVASYYFLMHPFSFHCSRFDAVLICFSGSDLGDIITPRK